MVPLGIQLPDGFLEQELRCEYLVEKPMKEVWAVQLDLLSQLQRVCKKHGLTYYADSGTLIGAVRHKGFIPWDDDIDIVMKREDYNKLIEIGSSEFADPYFLQSAHSDSFTRGFARLRNTKTTAITAFDSDKNYNHGIFIDIFPLDQLPDNEYVRKIWRFHIRVLSRFMTDGALRYPKKGRSLVANLMIGLANKYFRSQKRRDAYVCRYEKLCARYNGKKTKSISYVAYSHLKKKHIWDTVSFDSSCEVPFEFMTISIPKGFDSRLRVEYGDYMVMHHAPTVHGDCLFDVTMPYEEYVKFHSQSEIMEGLGIVQ